MQNVCDLPAKRAERIAELRAVLKRRNLHVKPDDDRQMLLLLRAGNCDPERAADVTKVFLDYKRTMLGSECPTLQQQGCQGYSSGVTGVGMTQILGFPPD